MSYIINHMKYVLLSLLFLVGCAAHRGPVLNATGSLCFDGVVVNLYEAGCEEIFVNQIPGTLITQIRCSVIGDDLWSQHFFYFVPQGAFEVDSSWNAVCSDPSTNTYFRHRDVNIVD